MKVRVYFMDGRNKTFENVRDVRNQDRDYRLPPERDNGTVVLIPKTSVQYLEMFDR